jgi:hypothetical protein
MRATDLRPEGSGDTWGSGDTLLGVPVTPYLIRASGFGPGFKRRRSRPTRFSKPPNNRSLPRGRPVGYGEIRGYGYGGWHSLMSVVEHDGQVVDSGPDDLALTLRFFAEYGRSQFIADW